MVGLFAKALAKAGYHLEPTAKNVAECFKDYVDSGTWHNLHLEDGKVYLDNGELVENVTEMAKALLHLL